ncbi:MAG TPA: hypothetical protein VEL05_07915 [Candidatus Acidoferrum sp.]|nr:hypothetical protein [Candidatus Acidoferrum sp.]
MRSTLRDTMAILLACGLVAGCTDIPEDSGPGGGDSQDGADPGDDPGDAPGGGGGSQAIDPIEGHYEVTTTYDMGSIPVVTDLLVLALSALDGLAADPAGKLIELLDRANIPILDQLLGLLDALILDKLNDFINDFVLNRVVDGLTVPDQLTDLLNSLTGLLSAVSLVSELDLAKLDQNGVTSATHTLSALTFSWQGQTIVADTPELIDRLTGAHGVACEVSMDADGGEIAFADHAFDLPFSDLAVVGLNQFVAQSFGVADLRGALGQLFDCPALAEDVASQCLVPAILCVGHRDELEQLCEAGLDQVTADIENRLRVLDFASMRFEAGQAILNRGADGVVDSIDGSWQTIVHVDQADVPMPAPFVARRRD